MTGARVLQRLDTPPAVPVRCELCGAAIGQHRRHVLDRDLAAVDHACHACGQLFGTSIGRFRTIPERVLLGAIQIDADEWSAMGLPSGLVLFVASRAGEHAACVPGAAMTCAMLSDPVWHVIATSTPLATLLAPDVEALVVYGEPGAATLDCVLIPLDLAHDLARRLRDCARACGDARTELARFFIEVAQRTA